MGRRIATALVILTAVVLVLTACEPIALKQTIADIVGRRVVLLTPENEAQIAEKTPELTWSSLGDAASYEVQLSVTDDFANAAIGTAAEMKYEITDPLSLCDERYWRVRAIGADGIEGPWSDIRRFSICVSAQPEIIGQLDLPNVFGDVCIEGDYAFIGHGGGEAGGMSIVNISDPYNPVLVREYPYDPGLNPQVYEGFLYCFETDESLFFDTIHKVDVSDPENPVSVGTPLPLNNIELDGKGPKDYSAWNCMPSVMGPLFAVYADEESTGVMFTENFDYAGGNPSSSGMILPTSYEPDMVIMVMTTILVSVSGEGILSFSLSGEIDAFDTYGIAGLSLGIIETSGNTAFVSDMNGVLTILDFSNPLDLSLVGTYNPGSGNYFPTVSGHYLFLGLTPSGTFQIIDIRDPAAPVIVSEGNPGVIQEVAGNYAYGGEFLGRKFNVFDLLPESH